MRRIAATRSIFIEMGVTGVTGVTAAARLERFLTFFAMMPPSPARKLRT